MFRGKYPFARNSMLRSVLGVTAAIGVIAVVSTGSVLAQATPPVAAPPVATPEAAALEPVTFTAQQVTSGRGLFGNSCSACHGETLGGLDGGPPLAGPVFAHWYTGPVSALFDYIHTRMPADRPGSLTPTQAAALASFILAQNGFVAGDVPLPEDPAALALMGFRQ